MKPIYQSGTDCALADSIRLVLDFASRLLEVMQNPFGKSLEWEKKGRVRNVGVFSLSALVFLPFLSK